MVFTPNLVVTVSAYKTTGFEDGTLNQPYDGDYFVTEIDSVYESGSDEFEVDNTEVKEGAKAFKVYDVANEDIYGWWNYTTVGSSNYLYRWSCQLLCVGSGDRTINFYNHGDKQTDTPVIQISIDESEDCWEYTDHNGQEQVIYDQNELNSGDWYEVGWQIVDNDTIYYWSIDNATLKDTDYVTGSPRFTTWDVGVDYIDSMRINVRQYAVGSRSLYLDTHNFSFSGTGGGVGDADGNITICVYNETDPTVAIPDWTLLVYDHLGGIYYSGDYNNNPVTLNHSVYGTGETYFEIGADGYSNRTYYADIKNGIHYVLDAFLAYENDTHLYYIQCLDSTDDAIYDVEVHITRGINGSRHEIASGFTNAFGAFPVYLLESTAYDINLSHSNYNDITLSSFVTDPDDYGVDHPIIFYMDTSKIDFNLTSMENIHFNGTINSTGVIHVWYEDFNSSTEDTTVYIYEYNSSSDSYTLNHTDSRTDENKFDFTDTGYNTSRRHRVVLHLNHTVLGYVYTYFDLMPIRDTTSESDLEGYFDDVFGDMPLGWVKTFLVFLPCMFFLICFGSNHVGLGIMTSGMYLGFVNFFIDIENVTTVNGDMVLPGVAGLLIVIGFFVIIVKRGYTRL